MRLISKALVILIFGVWLYACSDLPDGPPNLSTDAEQILLDGAMSDQGMMPSGSADAATNIDVALMPSEMDARTSDMDGVESDLSVPDVQLVQDGGFGDLGIEDMSVVPQVDAMVMDINPPERELPGLPLIHDFSGADLDRVNRLVRRAVEGLGLSPETAPNERDRIFVGRSYMVWLDETGFYGKMNGLWPLNGDAGTLDFLLLDGLRPVNLLIVGENGNGYWPGGYQGSEHIEFPNTVPEADDNPDCSQAGSFCAQYSLGEANPYTDPDIPTWRACNAGRVSFDTHFAPISIEATNRGLRIMYEGPLTKQGDFGGSTDGNGCHQNYLFPDGVRRLVHLRVGYELHVDDPSLDRLLQVRNPDGNPTFDGPFNFIGGFVMTQYPSPHRLKGLNGYLYVNQREVTIQWNDRRLPITPRQWIPLPTDTPRQDVVLGWANQRVTLSAFSDFVKARSLSVSNHGPNENGDSGFCLCVVHGGIEMGGGLSTGPVDGGRTSEVSVRRLTIHQEADGPEDDTHVYQAETDLAHVVGRLDADGWSASTGQDEAGHLVFGPYAEDWSTGAKRAVFRMLLDVVNERPEIVATIDVFDATTNELVAERRVLRSEFAAPFTYRNIHLDFDTTGREGHRMETRLYWHDISYLRLDSVTVLAR